MNRIGTFLSAGMLLLAGFSLHAQKPDLTNTKQLENKLFNHLDLGLTVGTTGLGLDLAMPIGKVVKVRTGVSWIPPVNVPLHFNVMSYSNGTVTENNFDKAQELLKGLTGFDVNKNVTVDAKPNIVTWKLLFDVYPFRNNKHWHFTAGFYLGGKKIGSAVNGVKDAPTLVGVGMYNSIYDYFTSPDEPYINEPIYGDVYIDPEVGDAIRDKLLGYGRLGVHIGDQCVTDEEGNQVKKPFMMVPSNDATLRADAIVNHFRPYLGFGYGGYADKAKRLYVGLEAGAMFWGGHPKIITYNGARENADDPIYATDLTRDVENVRGKVGDYIKFIKTLKVYPVLEFRMAYTLF